MSSFIPTYTAKDIMTEEVLMAYEGWSIKKLMDFYIRHGISGAPVIASDHSLVGVVTATDVVNFENKSYVDKSDMVETIYHESVGYTYQKSDIEKLALNADENCTVHQIMAKYVIQVDEGTSIDDIADIMLNKGVRRLFVTRNSLMIGVITTTNILKAIVDSSRGLKEKVA